MTTPLQDPTGLGEWVSVETFARSGDRDDTAAFARALERHTHVFVPPRTRPYEIRAREYLEAVRHPYGVLVPGGRKLRGAGADAIIRTILPDARDVAGSHDSFHRNTVSWFLTDWGGTDIEFSDLAFLGEGPVLTRDNWLLNRQMSVITLAWGRGAQGRPAANIIVRRCRFDRQFGFTVHQAGGGHGIEYAGNAHIDCMNGVNINADQLLCTNNRFVRSEGFECAGSHSWFLDNVFQDVIQALSIGGNQSEGPDNQSHAVTVRRNTIDGTVWMATADGPMAAITIADNVRDVLIAENHVLRAAGIGIHVHTPDRRRPTQDIRITRNTLISIGLREEATRQGRRENSWSRYSIYIDQADDVEIFENTIADRLPGEGPGRFAARAAVLARAGGRGLRIGPNEVAIEGEHYQIVGEYEGLEVIR